MRDGSKADKVYTQAEVDAMERVFVFPGKKFKSAEAHFGYFIAHEKQRALQKLRRAEKVLAEA